MGRAFRLLAVAGPLLTGCLHRTDTKNAEQHASETRAMLAQTIRRSFREQTLAPWYPRAVDRDSGGFLSEFDAGWAPSGPQDKMIVTQARHVWTTARAAQFFPADTVFLPASTHGFLFLRDKMWDTQYGGFYWLVTRGGTVKEDAPGRMVKQAYGEAFGIYALAGYYDVSHDERALSLAKDAFHWLDRHAHDPAHGGYFNYMERDGTPLRTGYRTDPPKDQNSSIHILEALTELYRVWPDPTLRERVSEMLTLIRDTMRVDPGYLRLFFAADWTPISYRDSAASVREKNHYYDHVSFGHDIETAYLMLEASEILGRANDSITERYAKQMVDHAVRNGWDTAAGGLYDEGYYLKDKPGIAITYPTKNWWAQAEALNSLLLMADRYPSDSLDYWTRFQKQWAYIDANLVDHEHGGWYQGGLDKEPQQKTALKGHIWKAAYHESRALMNVIRRLEATPQIASEPLPADPQATPETRALFINLHRLSGSAMLFGHADDLAYGFNWRDEPGRSDVKETSGSYPSVYGWDVNTLFAKGPGDAGGTVAERRLRGWIAEGFARGGVITMHWHADNPVSHGNAWDTTRAVAQLLPGGSHHAAYRARLDTVARFFNTLRARGRSGEETLVPVIFRPYHELSGSWFWWGRNHASQNDFVALWRFTVDYLRRDRGVHNVLYAYSTDVFDSKDAYLERYPGDAYVDVVGFDDYQSVRSPATRDVFVRRLRDVVQIADGRGKIAALSETGIEAIPDSTWWTGTLLPAIKNDSVARRIAWTLVWRNANQATDRKNHFYAPYAGQPSAADFRRFRDDPFVRFEDELPDLYHIATRAGASP